MSVTFADVEAAARRLDGHAIRTPLVEARASRTAFASPARTAASFASNDRVAIAAG